MAELAISVAEKLIEVIGSAVIQKLCAMWNYKAELEDLSKTVSTIKNVLLEFDSKRELSNNERAYVEDLKDAVYDADDLFDEFLILAELNQLDDGKNIKFTKKVRHFFSLKKKEVTQAYKMSHEVKKIKKLLDGIVCNYKKFELSFDNKPIRKRKETYSQVNKRVIVGRDSDVKAVKDMLLGPNVNEGVNFLTIVGAGGLGKTTLAKLVYNDEEVESKFSDPAIRLWVCVADQDGQQFDVKAILCKILDLGGVKLDCTSSMELVQQKFQDLYGGKKYLLVLDDVWNEDRKEWRVLEDLLMLGQGGSRVLITTRSETTATIIGDKKAYKLKGLSDENSWSLFEALAFDKGPVDRDYPELVEIGKKIVKKCCNSPLAIEVVGSLLYGKDISKWRSFEESGLADIGNGDNDIMFVLKLSYHNLESSVKSCFSYCAIFPKDSVIKKEVLIGLWMAQGYIVPFDKGQSIELAAEEHFLTLLRRCFFLDVEIDEFGDVESVKLHDLMHDVAQQVGMGEICVLSSITNNLGDKIRHVHFVGEEIDGLTERIYLKSKIRSILCCYNTQIENWKYLRVLYLRGSYDCLPDSIGNLLHLRFLDLSENYSLETLPDSIIQLHNLQTLILYACRNLRELPKEFSKLVKLRHLDLKMCDSLTSMPLGMDKLTCLRVLTFFMIGYGGRSELENLKVLSNLQGSISMMIGVNFRNVVGMNDMEGGYLKRSRHLNEVDMDFDNRCDDFEGVMENLEPPPNLKGFHLKSYKGKTIPRWGRAEDNWAISIPLLVNIDLANCSNLEQLPLLSKLPYLKTLYLRDMDKLEYMENKNSSIIIEELTTFCPSLETLHLVSLPLLKGWLVEDDDSPILTRRLIFPRLSNLTIIGCPSLKSIPSCPSLQFLQIDDLDYLMPDGLQYLTSLRIFRFTLCHSLEVLPKSISCLSSLQSLELNNCPALKSLPESLQKLTSLQYLSIYKCPELKERCKKPDGEYWPRIQHIPKMRIW